MSDKPALIRTAEGYLTFVEKPSPEALRAYYRDRYFHTGQSAYQVSYSDSELAYLRAKIHQKYAAAEKVADGFVATSRLLDVGCGEGFGLAWFAERDWEVVGLDYSRKACSCHHPALAERVREGDIGEGLEALVLANEGFDIVWLDNVLEHTPEPLELLGRCRDLLRSNGVLVVEVPNDFSKLQSAALRRIGREEPFWVFHPDHLSYFNREGLAALAAKAGLTCRDVLGDYPIDLHLLCPSTDYVADGAKGKECHAARIEFENLLHEISPEKTNTLYRALAALGLGRQIIAFFQRA